jgi:hypothetical protein
MDQVRFRAAPTVKKGDPITSRERNGQAGALIDKMVSGLGDPTFRIAQALLGLAGSLRNTDASGNLQAPIHEWLSLYQFVDPAEATYPDAGPGEPEGINVVTPLGAFKDGNEAMGVWAEADRLNNFPLMLDGSVIPAKDSEWWELAKLQRGFYDPATGGVGSPSFNAARAHLGIRYGRDSFHGTSFASYSAVPGPSMEEMGEGPGWCDDADWPDTPPSRNLVIYFSSVREGVNATGLQGTVTELENGGLRLTYPGTCPNHDGHVLDVYKADGSNGAYWVAVKQGSGVVWDVLSVRDWVEGPYTAGGRLQRHAMGLNRVLNIFAAEFRGTPEQVAAGGLEAAFHTHYFATRQYHLAPARGQEVGDVLVGTYPGWRIETPAPKGTLLTYLYGGGTEHPFFPGMVCTGCLVLGLKVAAAVIVEALDGETVIERFTVAPDEDGTIDRICMFAKDVTPAALRFRLGSELKLTGEGGRLAVEATELYPYKATVEDWYVVLRLSGAIDGRPDGVGIMEERAREIGEHFARKGCITNVNQRGWMPGNEGNGFGGNAVVDAFRRFSQDVARIVTEPMFLGIACQGGKTHLWFERIWDVNGIEVDPWVNLAPGRMQVDKGALRTGYRYKVRSGTIWYGGEQLGAGDVFTAVAGEAEWGGTGEVFEADGIRAEAPPGGESNQWLLGCWLAPYDQVNGGDNEASIYKPSVYGRIYPFAQRCFLGSTELFNRYGNLKWHLNQGQPLAWKPEAPSGYTYTPQFPGGGACNRFEMSDANQLLFYQSCRIYEPDLLIESAVTEIEDGRAVVHLTLAGRIHNTSEAVELDEDGNIVAASWRAPASFERDVETWDTAAVQAERVRSLENGLMERMIYRRYGAPATIKIGDRFAKNPEVEMPGPGSPEGCSFPSFLLTKLPTLVYEDNNATQEPATDTPFSSGYIRHLEFVIRAIGPGYLDGATTERIACITDNEFMADFDPESLCYAAFGKASFNWLSEDDRPDNVPGFGPVPMTLSRAELFNQFSKALDKLKLVRVDVPLDWPTTSTKLGGRRATSLDPYEECQAVLTTPASVSVSLPPEINIHAICSSTLVKSDGKWWVDTFNQTSVLTAEFLDAATRYCLPEGWRDQAVNWLGVVCEVIYSEGWNNGREATTDVCDCSGGVTRTFDPGFSRHSLEQTYCRVFDTMSISVDPPPECWHFGCQVGGLDCACEGAGNLRAMIVVPKTNAGAYLSVPLTPIAPPP